MSDRCEDTSPLSLSGGGRRTFLGRLAAAAGLVLFPEAGGLRRASAREDDPSPGLIGAENRKPGSLD